LHITRRMESVSPLNGQNRNGFTHQPMTRNPRAALCARALLKSPAVATEAVPVARTA